MHRAVPQQPRNDREPGQTVQIGHERGGNRNAAASAVNVIKAIQKSVHAPSMRLPDFFHFQVALESVGHFTITGSGWVTITGSGVTTIGAGCSTTVGVDVASTVPTCPPTVPPLMFALDAPWVLMLEPWPIAL